MGKTFFKNPVILLRYFFPLLLNTPAYSTNSLKYRHTTVEHLFANNEQTTTSALKGPMV